MLRFLQINPPSPPMIFIKQKSFQGRPRGGKKENVSQHFSFCTTACVLGGWPRSVQPLETKIVLVIDRRSETVPWRFNRFVTTRRTPAEPQGGVCVCACQCVTYRDIHTRCHMCAPCFLDVVSPHFLFFFPSLTALTCFRPLRLSVFVLAGCVYIKSCAENGTNYNYL